MELYAHPTVERVVVQSFEKYKNNVNCMRINISSDLIMSLDLRKRWQYDFR